MSIALLALGLTNQMEKQDNKFGDLSVPFARLEGHELPHIKIQKLLTNPDLVVMVIENDCIWKIRYVWLIKEGIRKVNAF